MSRALKADLHVHAKEDVVDLVSYRAKDVIDRAAKRGYRVLSFTFHDQLFYPLTLQSYAKKRGILLIPGIEKTIEGKHVLLYNFFDEELRNINSFSDLRKLKQDHHLVIAPHVFYPGSTCLRDVFIEHEDLFDAIEYCSLHTRWYNPNKHAVASSHVLRKPLVATTDLHILRNFGRQYCVIDADLAIGAVISSIKQGRVKNKVRPMSSMHFFCDVAWYIVHEMRRLLRLLLRKSI